MKGLSPIIRKELLLHISSKRFFFSSIILLLSLTMDVIGSSLRYNQSVAIQGVDEDCHHQIFWGVPVQIMLFGSIVALGISYNSITEEKENGTLKVILSYPVFRDVFLVGKILAGIITLSIVLFFSLSFSLGVSILITGRLFYPDSISKIFLIYLLSIVYLSFFLCLGTMLSIKSKKSTTSILIGILIVFVLGSNLWISIRNILESLIVSNLHAYSIDVNSTMIGNNIKKSHISFIQTSIYFNPSRLYQKIIMLISVSKLSDGISISIMILLSNIILLLYKLSHYIAILFAYTIIGFITCYILFRNMEIS